MFFPPYENRPISHAQAQFAKMKKTNVIGVKKHTNPGENGKIFNKLFQKR